MARIRPPNGPSDLRPQFAGRHAGPFFEIEAWMPSEINAISPLVDRLMRLIEGSHCVCGEEPCVELALAEALNNAVVHGNRMDRKKLVEILCRCELGKGVHIVVTDQGQGFDPNAVPDPTAAENIGADHGRGIWVMKSVMDELSFERGGTEVHMRKAATPQPKTGSEAPTECFPSVRQAEPNAAPPSSAGERVNSSSKRG
jgi:serine/threonine-protein kinase RsbW